MARVDAWLADAGLSKYSANFSGMNEQIFLELMMQVVATSAVEQACAHKAVCVRHSKGWFFFTLIYRTLASMALWTKWISISCIAPLSRPGCSKSSSLAQGWASMSSQATVEGTFWIWMHMMVI